MRQTLGVIALGVASIQVLAGCSGHRGPVPGAHGTVTGTLLQVGGPPPGAPVPLTGHLVAIDSRGARFTAAAGGSGRYRMSLPPGVYRLTGHSPLVYPGGAELECSSAHAVHVAAGQVTSAVAVICSIR